jgi:hypothetical protein
MVMIWCIYLPIPDIGSGKESMRFILHIDMILFINAIFFINILFCINMLFFINMTLFDTIHELLFRG